MDEDFSTYAETINRICERFKQKQLTSDMIECFTFVHRLMANKNVEIRAIILTKLEKTDQTLTLYTVGKECQIIVNLRQDENRKEVLTSTRIPTGKE